MASRSAPPWVVETAPRLGRIVTAPALPEGYGLVYTTVDFSGRLSGEDRDAVLAFLAARWGEGIGLATCTQVHGSEVVFAGNPATGWREIGSCDALWTDRPRTALGIKVADCLPVTIVDPVARVVANVHSGWRGAADAIVPRTIETLQRLSSFSADAARAWLGPSIRSCCFEVGEEVVGAFEERFGSVGAFVDRSRGERPHFDLAGLTRRLLAEAGIAEDRVEDSGLCSRCEGSIFHSYRRSGPSSGRILAIAVQA